MHGSVRGQYESTHMWTDLLFDVLLRCLTTRDKDSDGVGKCSEDDGKDGEEEGEDVEGERKNEEGNKRP